MNEVPRSFARGASGTSAQSGYKGTYKFGITKSGAKRPKAQLKRCKKIMGADCDWDWVRDDVDGWLKARRLEAGYAMRYKITYGEFPKGMSKGL